MKPVDVKDNTCIDDGKERSNKDPKFKFGDHVRIPNAKTFFVKDILPTGQKKYF